MSKQFKPVHEQFAEKLIAELKAGTSPIQQPVKENGLPAFILPYNAATGKNYRGLNALIIGMKGFDDPRFMSANQARFSGNLVREGAKGTLISFTKNSDIQAIRTPEGEKIKDEAGVTQTKTVEFAKPEKAVAFVFNASQLKDYPMLGDKLIAKPENSLSPVERAEKLLADSKATIVHGGNEAYYDKARDVIHLPEMEQFENETKYYQAAIHQLAHWTGHESRLNRPMEGKFGSLEYAGEELRASLAAMMVGSELQIGHSFGQHTAYSGNWIKMLKDQPFEISKAATSAQKMADFILDAGQKREVKQEAGNNTTLSKGEEIAYNNTTYKVLEKKGKTFEIEKTDTGEKFKAKPMDKIFQNLIEARNNPVSQELELETEASHKIGR